LQISYSVHMPKIMNVIAMKTMCSFDDDDDDDDDERMYFNVA